MCGIAAALDPSLNEQESLALVRDMLDITRHRGPDASDAHYLSPVCLGHNRLSILDLSEHGNQPMYLDELSIIFNGEIYNYVEIREELEQLGETFKTGSDTEVLLHAYRKWGSDCVKKFVGMWALAIWDEKSKTLFCSRDPFGIKPFYYINSGDKLYFASEYKALKKTSLFDGDINIDQVSRGLQLGWMVHGEETYFNCIKNLPPAHNLTYQNGAITIERYWDVDTTVKKTDQSEEDQIAEFRDLFLNSINMHMRADVEVGGCLSGGLDSSAITCAVQHLFPEVPYKTFNIYYDGADEVDERPWIDYILKDYPKLDPYYHSPSDQEIRDDIEKVIHHQDVPIGGSSPISQYMVMKLAASKDIKVLLDGQGADEYLGGYLHTYYRIIADHIVHLNLFKTLGLLFQLTSRHQLGASGMVNYLAKSLVSVFSSEQSMTEVEYRNKFAFLVDGVDGAPFDLSKMDKDRAVNLLYQLVTKTTLPTLLHYEDRNSMAFSIESRVPFLDHRLVQKAFDMGMNMKVHGLETKYILRESMRGIVPDAILDRKDKKGFVTPGEVKWLRGPLSDLTNIDLGAMPYINKSKAQKILSEYNNGSNRNAKLVWRLAMLDLWAKNN